MWLKNLLEFLADLMVLVIVPVTLILCLREWGGTLKEAWFPKPDDRKMPLRFKLIFSACLLFLISSSSIIGFMLIKLWFFT